MATIKNPKLNHPKTVDGMLAESAICSLDVNSNQKFVHSMVNDLNLVVLLGT